MKFKQEGRRAYTELMRAKTRFGCFRPGSQQFMRRKMAQRSIANK
jgi:hypothetical protein